MKLQKGMKYYLSGNACSAVLKRKRINIKNKIIPKYII